MYLGWNTICALYVGAVIRNAGAIESVARPRLPCSSAHLRRLDSNTYQCFACTREEYFTRIDFPRGACRPSSHILAARLSVKSVGLIQILQIDAIFLLSGEHSAIRN